MSGGNLVKHEMRALEQQINAFLSTSEIILHGENMLSRMEELMRVIGNPEEKLRVIHVAGTSGKTSTSYFVTGILKNAGLKTCLTVSPHIATVRERAIIDLEPLDAKNWIKYMREFFEIVSNSGVRPSYFEFFMGFAYWVAEKERVDFMVAETGLGGTWDGSNIARREDKICVICEIGEDHVEILGDDILDIVAEKAGIIHADNRVFMNAQGSLIEERIQAHARLVGAKLDIAPAPKDNFLERNFALAKRVAVFALESIGVKFEDEKLDEAKKIRIPARAEEFQYDGKMVVLDGSHNPQKLRAFVDYMKNKYKDTPCTLLVTLGANKVAAVAEDFAILGELSEKIVLTSFKNEDLETKKRASLDEDMLMRGAREAGFLDITYIEDANEALAVAVNASTRLVVVTGSLYLTAKLYEQLKNAHG